MKILKYIGIFTITSSTLLFSGCVVHRGDSPSIQNSNYSHNIYDRNSRISQSLLSYSYPYYFDRPFYYLDGRYYYGGFFRDGFYHYGNRRFRHGHYYSRGYRYYNGRRYRAINRQHGYFRDRDSYKRSDYCRKRNRDSVRRVDRGRQYRSRDYDDRDGYYNNTWNNKHIVRHTLKRTIRKRLSR